LLFIPQRKLSFAITAAILCATLVLQYLMLTVYITISASGVFYPFAFLVALFLGFRPALVHIFGTFLSGYFLIYEPQFQIAWKGYDQSARMLIYVVTSVLVAFIVERGRRAERALLQAKQEAETSRKRMQDFFSRAPVPLATLQGPDHRYELANAAYLQLVGMPQSIVGRTVSEVLPGISPDLIKILDDVYRTGERFVGKEFPVVLDWHHNGKPFPKFIDFMYEPIPDGIMVIAYDLSDAVTARMEVEESESKIRSFAEAMPQMAFIADKDGSLEYFNRRWYDFVGMPKNETEGWNWQGKVHHPDDEARTLEVWLHSLRTGELYEIEYRLRRHDGQYRWHLGRAIPVRNSRGEILRWFGTNTDIHDQKTTQEALASAVKSRDDFLSVAAHELRTPVTALLLQSQLRHRQLLKRNEPYDLPTLNSMFEQDQRQVLRLSHLMNDILDVTSLEKDRVESHLEKHNLVGFASGVAERMQPLFSAKGVSLSLQFPDSLEAVFDPLRLERAVSNLLTNALKYGEGKPVRLCISSSEDEACIEVIDHGPGIAPGDQARIFERFERAVSNKDISGLGLGLFIAREIVESCRGQLELESSVGNGACFRIKLARHIEPKL
jgi:two-component system sensor histidine kinase VicK